MAENEHNKTLLEWQAPEFIPAPRGRRWFLGAGVITLSLVAYAILTGSATMAILFLVLAGVYTLTHSQPPRILTMRIREMGVDVGGKFYPYNTIKGFWIVFDPPFVSNLQFIAGNGKSDRRVKVELAEQDPSAVRKRLASEVPEMEGMQEPLTDTLIRLFRLQ